MKFYHFIFAALLVSLIWGNYISAGAQPKQGDRVLWHSIYFEEYPQPFSELHNVDKPGQAAVSTGYYFVDSDDEADDFWRPTPNIIDTTTEPESWHRIMPGPRMLAGSDGTPRKYWEEHPEEGLRFFRNPAIPANPDENRNFFTEATDSTDDAIAGPIPIGFNFYFNGLRYDSFYVSTNGIIALSNRRYFYDQDGNRTIPAGSATGAYDPMSADWFEETGSRDYKNHSGDGLNDPAADDYGYHYMACGGDPEERFGGLRKRVESDPEKASLSEIPYKTAVIAPFWMDAHLSQYNQPDTIVDDWGRVYYKRFTDEDKIIIYIINIAPKGRKFIPLGDAIDVPADIRPGDESYLSANAQVTIDNSDSSIVIIFERFDGTYVFEGRGYPANRIFRASSCCGVRGFARHVNYGQAGGSDSPWAGEYEQYTHYYNNDRDPRAYAPHNYLAVRFKQWKNTLRVVDIQYHVRSKDPEASLDFNPEGCEDCIVKTSRVKDYELLAGEERIGAIQPVILVQNLTNEIQGLGGVNFNPQELNFRARFRIMNQATGRIVYNRLVPIDSTCLDLPDSLTQDCTGDPYVKVRYVNVTKKGADYEAEENDPLLPYKRPGIKFNGIKPYGFVQISFPPFEPYTLENHLGKLRAIAIADPTDPRTGERYNDEWPFDDTTFVDLFVMRRLSEFNDDVSEYHIYDRVPYPSLKKWVSIEAEVTNGEAVSAHPASPRGRFSAANNENYTMESPVIRLNRRNLRGEDLSSGSDDYAGDEIRSFPIDMRDRYGAVLTMSIQRATKRDRWDRGWCDRELIGPEPRAFLNGDLTSQFGRRYQSAEDNYPWEAPVSYNPDWIEVQFMSPSPDGINFITNVPDERWQIHPRRGGLPPVTDMPAYKLWGSNGYSVGFLETDPDSALSHCSYPDLNGYRPDIYDDGIDEFYQHVFIPIPDTIIRAKNEGAKNFRFRIRVRATDDKKCPTCIPDDDDPFYVDNVRILNPGMPDGELTAVRMDWPYSMVPASLAERIPVFVRVKNISPINYPTFWVKLRIFEGHHNQDTNKIVYSRVIPQPFMKYGEELELQMPSWNARKSGPGKYRLLANLFVPGGDLTKKNDTNYTDVEIRFGDAIAYDPPDNPRNDVPDDQFSGTLGRGLNLYGYVTGGLGSATSYNIYEYDEEIYGCGDIGGSGSGQIAMKFVLNRQDTIYGYQAFFGSLNAVGDVALSIYTDKNSIQPAQRIDKSIIYRLIGWDEVREEAFYNEYVTYLLPEPLVLEPGTYWMAVAQLGETGFQLGASKNGMGMRTTNCHVSLPVDIINMIGGYGNSLMVDDKYRKYSDDGKKWINNNLFAFENTRNSGQWNQFMPTVGNPGYAHLGHFGCVNGDKTATLSRGTWMPLMRVYMGERSYGPGTSDVEEPPLELIYLEGRPRANGINLEWKPVNANDIHGFYVERRKQANGKIPNWKDIGFVKADNTQAGVYDYFDTEVVPGQTYRYRIYSVDRDGAASARSRIVTVRFTAETGPVIYKNNPNPFRNYTRISFALPEPGRAKLVISDIFGNKVKTIYEGLLPAGRHEYVWRGDLAGGAKAPAGIYFYELSAGGKTMTGKMTMTR